MMGGDPRQCPKCGGLLVLTERVLNMVFNVGEGPQIGGKLRPHVVCSHCEFEAMGVTAHE